MGTINPRARGDASLKADRRAAQDDRQQIRRMLSRPPRSKPPIAPVVPVVPVAAGSLGSSMAMGSHALLSPGVLAFGGWSFSQSFDGVSTGNPTLTAGPGDNDFTIGEAGWYQLGVVKRADFTSGTPGALEVEINLSSVGYEPVWTLPLASAADNPQGTHGAMVDVGTRALYLTAGEVVSPRMRWTGGGTMYDSRLTVFVTRLG